MLLPNRCLPLPRFCLYMHETVKTEPKKSQLDCSEKSQLEFKAYTYVVPTYGWNSHLTQVLILIERCLHVINCNSN